MKNKSLLFIGDIHGQYQKLTDLLDCICCNQDNPDWPAYQHLVFLGDLIDNGPGQNPLHLATLELVKSLCDQGSASCVMGNHEFNAIGWAMIHPETGDPLRPHNDNNTKQHQQFLNELKENSALHLKWINWFKRLPLFCDFGHVKAIHACWQLDLIEKLKPYLNEDNSLQEIYWPAAFDKTHELYQLCEVLLKGPELALPTEPEAYYFLDKTGTKRYHIRVKWWKDRGNHYRDIAQVQDDVLMNIPDIPLPADWKKTEPETIIVVGHYTLSGLPAPLSSKVICVDYNGAHAKGDLVAYCMWHDEDEPHQVSEQNFWSPTLPEFGREGISALSALIKSLPEQYPEIERDAENYDVLENGLRNILLQYWDPVHVNGDEEVEDEYDTYLPAILRLGIHGTWGEISAYLMGLTICDFSLAVDRERCDRIAMRINTFLKKI